MAESGERRLTGRHVLFGMLAFFGVVIGVNAFMMWQAYRSYDGVQEDDAYRKGRDFNAVLEAARAQEARGWRVAVEHGRTDGGEVAVTARFRDGEGGALNGLEVEAHWFSPVESEEDRRLRLDGQGDGVYRGALALPRAGNWELRILAERPSDGLSHELRKEVILAP